MFTFVAKPLLMWSYYLLLRHFRPWPAVMEKLHDELKAWSDSCCMAICGLGVSQAGFSPLDGSRSILFFFFFRSPPTLCFTWEWWNVKEWSLIAKLYEHHAAGIYIRLALILHLTKSTGPNMELITIQITHPCLVARFHVNQLRVG